MVRYCTSGLLYFTSLWRVKYSPQVQCLTILHSTTCNDKFIIIILTPKEMATTVATRAGAAMVVIIAKRPFHFGDWEYNHSGTGIDAERL